MRSRGAESSTITGPPFVLSFGKWSAVGIQSVSGVPRGSK